MKKILTFMALGAGTALAVEQYVKDPKEINKIAKKTIKKIKK